MSEDRHMIIHYNNGAKLEVSFSIQVRNSTAALMEAMKRALEAEKLVIEANDRLVIIPWASVRQVELTPVPAALPFGSIKNAKINLPRELKAS